MKGLTNGITKLIFLLFEFILEKCWTDAQVWKIKVVKTWRAPTIVDVNSQLIWCPFCFPFLLHKKINTQFETQHHIEVDPPWNYMLTVSLSRSANYTLVPQITEKVKCVFQRKLAPTVQLQFTKFKMSLLSLDTD